MQRNSGGTATAAPASGTPSTAVVGAVLALFLAYSAYDISQTPAGGAPVVPAHTGAQVVEDVSPYVDQRSLDGKIHVSFCQS